jgi:alkanesulfonate monooxygenase
VSPDPARTRGRRESRFGIWVPARGPSAALDHPRELLGASWERNRDAFDAGYKPELERSGIGFGEHDERYAYGREWLHVVRELLTGKRLDHDGRFFHIHGTQLRPAGRFRERPLLYVGGESEPVRTLVTDLGDVWLVKASSRRHRRPARRRPPPGPRRAALRFGMSAFVIARRSAEEATAELELQWRLDAESDARTAMLANTDP